MHLKGKNDSIVYFTLLIKKLSFNYFKIYMSRMAEKIHQNKATYLNKYLLGSLKKRISLLEGIL